MGSWKVLLQQIQFYKYGVKLSTWLFFFLYISCLTCFTQHASHNCSLYTHTHTHTQIRKALATTISIWTIYVNSWDSCLVYRLFSLYTHTHTHICIHIHRTNQIIIFGLFWWALSTKYGVRTNPKAQGLGNYEKMGSGSGEGDRHWD
jgi:hypothetical protein